MSYSDDELHRQMLELLIKIMDLEGKTEFEKQILAAWTARDKNEMYKVINALKGYIDAQSVSDKPTSDEDKAKTFQMLLEKKYDTPPTFDTLIIELTQVYCKDLANIPDLPDIVANVEKPSPDTPPPPPPPHTKKTGSKWKQLTPPKGKQVQTIIKKGMIVASAACQSGKTNFMICSAIKGMLHGKSAVIVVRNMYGDANQMKSNIERFNKMITSLCDAHSVVARFGLSVIDGSTLHKPILRDQVRTSLNGVSPSIVLCLGNNTQVGQINEIAKETNGTFTLYIDEIDKVDYGEASKNSESVSEILAQLKSQAYQVVGVTATPLDCIFSEVELKSANQIRLTPPSDYRGFLDILIKPLVLDGDTAALNKRASYEEICSADDNLKPFLETFSKSVPDYHIGSKKHEFPNICLLKNTRINENQDAIFKGLNKEYKGKFATVVSNGDGVKMYHPDLPLTFKVAGVSVTRGEFFKGDIADVLQYFKDNGGVIKYPRIIVIAGELAGRCISYVTRDYYWHLTDMYYNPAAGTPIPEMIQSAGRLCGLNKGKSHLHLHVTRKVADALWNGLNFTNEVINRAIASPLMNLGEEMSFGDSIKSVPMLKTKMPVKRNLTSIKGIVVRKDFKLVSKDDGGESVESYKYKLVEEPVAKVAKVETPVDKVDATFSTSLPRPGETFISCLKRKLTDFIKAGNSNHFRTRKEWFTITGLCGFKTYASWHKIIGGDLVDSEFMERDNDKLRVEEYK
jgi:hypothetical protein